MRFRTTSTLAAMARECARSPGKSISLLPFKGQYLNREFRPKLWLYPCRVLMLTIKYFELMSRGWGCRITGKRQTVSVGGLEEAMGGKNKRGQRWQTVLAFWPASLTDGEAKDLGNVSTPGDNGNRIQVLPNDFLLQLNQKEFIAFNN